MNNVLLVAGGPLKRELLERELAKGPAKVIAVDGGGTCLAEIGVRPDLLVGDFDSLDEEALGQFIRKGVEVLRFPVDKDQTDLELALDWLAGQGTVAAEVIGGLGERLDHTLANIGLLVRTLNAGLNVRLIDDMQELFVIRERTVIPAKPGWAISLIPLPAATGVRTDGLQYPLNREDLYFEYSRGVHNRFTAEEAVIDLESGILLVICFLEDAIHAI